MNGDVPRVDDGADMRAAPARGRAFSPNMQSICAMRRALVLAAIVEGVTGMALLIVPSLVGSLLLGNDLTGIATIVARVAGIALIALAITCWPGSPLIGMSIYGGAVALYLGYLGIASASTGFLLWPAVVAHVIMTALLIRELTSGGGTKT